MKQARVETAHPPKIEKALIAISNLRACGLMPADVYELLWEALEEKRAR